MPIVDYMSRIHTAQYSFYIDQYEVAELAKGDYFSIPYQMPLTAITHLEAGQICHRMGKRLCSRHEWISACLGMERRREHRQRGHRIEERRSAKERREETRERRGERRGGCNSGLSIPEAAALEATGKRSSCRSDLGPYDMIGNVMEWVTDPRAGGGNPAMGGSYYTAQADCFTTRYLPEDASNDMIGLRCCRHIEALGALEASEAIEAIEPLGAKIGAGGPQAE